MKFAFCVFKYFPYGGLERNCWRFAEVAVSRGHEVDIYCMRWEGEKPMAVNVIELNAAGWSNHRKCKSFVSQANKIIQKSNYDAVVGFNRMPGLDVFYAADICYARDVDSRRGWFYKMLPRYRVYAEFERAIFAKQSSTHILSIVEAEKEYCQQYYQTQDERFHAIPPGINPDRKAPENYQQVRKQLRAQMNIRDDENIILLVGSDFKRKGLDRALLALAHLPDAVIAKTQLWVIGKSDKKPYANMAKQLRVESRVKFLGASKDIPRLLCVANVLIHPAYREATGGILLEAVVAGLPVLATENCGFAFHIIKANAGIIVASSPFDQAKLDIALLAMLTSTQRENFSNNAIHYGKTVDLYSRADRAVDFIIEVAKRKTQ